MRIGTCYLGIVTAETLKLTKLKKNKMEEEGVWSVTALHLDKNIGNSSSSFDKGVRRKIWKEKVKHTIKIDEHTSDGEEDEMLDE